MWQFRLFILFLSIAACASAASSDLANQFIRKQPNNVQVIIFVHGFTGDASSTWTNTGNQEYWPRLMLTDKAFDGADIFTYEYPTALFTSHVPNVNELAENLGTTLTSPDFGLTKYQQIIFLTHSMGGLVVRQYLLKYRDVGEKVRFIYFYSTPMTGGAVAALAGVFFDTPQIGNMKPMEVNDYLGNLQKDWLDDNRLKHIPTYCAYELLPFRGKIIVDQISATHECNTHIEPIYENHADIVKPESRQSTSYQAFRNAYLSTTPIALQNKNCTPGKSVIHTEERFSDWEYTEWKRTINPRLTLTVSSNEVIIGGLVELDENEAHDPRRVINRSAVEKSPDGRTAIAACSAQNGPESYGRCRIRATVDVTTESAPICH